MVDALANPHLFTLQSLSAHNKGIAFSCEIQEYADFFTNDAFHYQERAISRTYLLLEKKTSYLLAYMVLIADSIELKRNEIDDCGMNDIPFKTFPAIKLAKLAVAGQSRKRYCHLGTLMLHLARGIAIECNETYVACRFLTVDADIEHNSTVENFYHKAHFVNNTRSTTTRVRSMRLDLYPFKIDTGKI